MNPGILNSNKLIWELVYAVQEIPFSFHSLFNMRETYNFETPGKPLADALLWERLYLWTSVLLPTRGWGCPVYPTMRHLLTPCFSVPAEMGELGMRDGKQEHREWERGASRGEMAQAGKGELSHGLPVMGLWSGWPTGAFPFLKEWIICRRQKNIQLCSAMAWFCGIQSGAVRSKQPEIVLKQGAENPGALQALSSSQRRGARNGKKNA